MTSVLECLVHTETRNNKELHAILTHGVLFTTAMIIPILIKNYNTVCVSVLSYDWSI